MNVRVPNLLLALTATFATGLAVLTASVFGAQDGLIRNLLLAGICAGAYVLLNPFLNKAIKRPPSPPLVNTQVQGSVLWAMLIPAIIFAIAAIPIFRPGYDYGLIVIIAAVLWGLTLESILKAWKADRSPTA